jgi:DNA invertase Pin-like site-specific DNA recombinase
MTSTTVDAMDHDTIHTLAADAGADDPIVALNAIAELHRELDRVEAVTVRSARNRGASWQLIALALGVSKQAVHKKYGRS